MKTIAHLADRPRSPLAARFGAHVPHLLACLLGEEDVRIVPRRSLPAITVEARFAEPVARTDDALATIADLAGRAATALNERAQGGRRFAVALYRSDGHVARLAVETGAPTRDPQVLDRLFRERIDALADPLDPGFGYDLIRLDVPVTEPLGPAQLALEAAASARANWRCCSTGSARGWGGAASAASRAPTRIFPNRPRSNCPPPIRRRATAGNRSPRRAAAAPAPSVRSAAPDRSRRRSARRPAAPLPLAPQPPRVARIEGPERIAAEWWRRKLGHEPGKGGLTRDYYRIEDARGRRFWVFRHGLGGIETPDPDWYLHGLFA